MKITGTNVLKQVYILDKYVKRFLIYLKTREPILDLVDDVLIGDPAHVEVTLERRVSVLPSLIIDQILKLVTCTNLLLGNGSARYKSNNIWPL